MSHENSETLSWPLLKERGCHIEELKKKVKCRKCGNSLENEKKFFGYRPNAGQTTVYQNMAKDYQEVLLRDYNFSHFGCS